MKTCILILLTCFLDMAVIFNFFLFQLPKTELNLCADSFREKLYEVYVQQYNYILMVILKKN